MNTEVFEYIDRENQNTVCIGTFSRVELSDIKSGDRFVVANNPKPRMFNGTQLIEFATGLPRVDNYEIRDKKTNYLIILTVQDIRGWHIKAKGFGSWASDLCYKLI